MLGLAGRRESADSDLQAEKDNSEIEDGLDRHMHRKGSEAQRRSERPVKAEDFKRGKGAPDHDAGHRAARHAVKSEQGAVVLATCICE